MRSVITETLIRFTNGTAWRRDSAYYGKGTDFSSKKRAMTARFQECQTGGKTDFEQKNPIPLPGTGFQNADSDHSRSEVVSCAEHDPARSTRVGALFQRLHIRCGEVTVAEIKGEVICSPVAHSRSDLPCKHPVRIPILSAAVILPGILYLGTADAVEGTARRHNAARANANFFMICFQMGGEDGCMSVKTRNFPANR